jgi:hypothetical protein
MCLFNAANRLDVPAFWAPRINRLAARYFFFPAVPLLPVALEEADDAAVVLWSVSVLRIGLVYLA